MKKMYIGNLPSDTSETEVQELFARHGTVRSIELVSDVFSGRCRGFGFVEMEGHEARAAMDALNGSSFKGNFLRIREERADRAGARTGGARRRRR